MDNFDWDEFKNIENKKKHGLWFEETLAAFDDPHGQQIEDKSTVGEQRFILLAQNGFNQIFVVIYSYEDSLIRIISARRANKKERSSYEKRL